MRILIIFLLALLPLTSHAISSETFYNQCKSAFQPPAEGEENRRTAERLIEAGTCVGFVGGTVSGINLMSNLMRQQNLIRKNLICMPPGNNPRQMMSEVISYLDKNADQRKLPLEAVIYHYFMNRYPCPEPTPNSTPPAPEQ